MGGQRKLTRSPSFWGLLLVAAVAVHHDLATPVRPVAPGAGDRLPGNGAVGELPAARPAEIAVRLALPAIALSVALGLLVVAWADSEARRGAAWADGVFWGGVLLILLPATARLIAPVVPRLQRIGIVAMLALALYGVKVLQSPLAFTYYDEFLHVRTTEDIATSGHLFHLNPLLPISPLYPGLESVVSVIMRASGLSAFAAGIVVIGAARLLLVLAMYLFSERLSASGRVAGTAALLYMANPNFVFWGSQFSYEPFALGVAMLTLAVLARPTRYDGRPVYGRVVVALLGIAAVVVSHHVTALFLALFLLTWAIVHRCHTTASLGARIRRAAGATALPAHAEPNPTLFALVTVAASVGWLFFVASPAVGYLSRPLFDAVRALIRLISGEDTGRTYFRSFNGAVSPRWEQATAFAAVGLLMGILPFGLIALWRAYARRALPLAVGVTALAYPFSLAIRLTAVGGDVSNRTSDFIFITLAPVIAIGMVGFLQRRSAHRWRSVAAVGAIAVIFVGGVIIGWPRSIRLPGPYLVSADTRSVEAKGIAAAEWARVALGPGNRIGADRINGVLMGTYGDQDLVTIAYDNLNVAIVVFSPDLGTAEQTILQQGRVQYLVVDRRLSTALPLFGVYFEPGEPGSYQHMTPVDPTALAKFDGIGNISRIYDDGEVVIYDVTEISNAP